MERMRQNMKETDITAKRVADEYKANVASMTEVRQRGDAELCGHSQKRGLKDAFST